MRSASAGVGGSGPTADPPPAGDSPTSRARSPLKSGGGSSFRIISISSVSELDTNGGFPTQHSYNTHPSAYRSEAYECTPPSVKSSGAM